MTLRTAAIFGPVLALVLLCVAKAFFVGYYRIPQNGMYPGLSAGSLLFTTKQAYVNETSIRRGDVIVFVREENGQRYDYIWRVVGLPGEKIVASGDSLVINDRAATRQRIREVDGKVIFREQIEGASYEVAFDRAPKSQPPAISVTVPAGQFFVMGDNRFDARDSRYFGPVALHAIVGKKL